MTKYAQLHQISSVFSSFLVAFSLRVIIEFLATIFGPVARLYEMDIFRHGIPISVGVLCFLFFQFHPRLKKWMTNVIIEVDKVVWPSRKDALAMTSVVCVILVLSGVILGFFDLTASYVMRFIMG